MPLPNASTTRLCARSCASFSLWRRASSARIFSSALRRSASSFSIRLRLNCSSVRPIFPVSLVSLRHGISTSFLPDVSASIVFKRARRRFDKPLATDHERNPAAPSARTIKARFRRASRCTLAQRTSSKRSSSAQLTCHVASTSAERSLSCACSAARSPRPSAIWVAVAMAASAFSCMRFAGSSRARLVSPFALYSMLDLSDATASSAA